MGHNDGQPELPKGKDAVTTGGDSPKDASPILSEHIVHLMEKLGSFSLPIKEQQQANEKQLVKDGHINCDEHEPLYGKHEDTNRGSAKTRDSDEDKENDEEIALALHDKTSKKGDRVANAVTLVMDQEERKGSEMGKLWSRIPAEEKAKLIDNITDQMLKDSPNIDKQNPKLFRRLLLAAMRAIIDDATHHPSKGNNAKDIQE